MLDRIVCWARGHQWEPMPVYIARRLGHEAEAECAAGLLAMCRRCWAIRRWGAQGPFR